LQIAPRRHAVGRSEIGVELDRPVEELQRLAVGFSRPLMNGGHAAEKIIISIKTLGGFAFGSFDLGLFQLRRDRADDVRSYLVLEIEDVLQPALKTVGPEMHTG